MKTFINDLVSTYLSEYGDKPLESCIITPSKRAHRYIKAELMAQEDSGFLPALYSIDDFIFKYTPLLRIDEIDLTYKLFEIFKKHKKEADFDFEEYLSYSSILLNDFNEIDIQMANGKDIYAYLTDVKAIQLWNPDGSPLSNSQKEYLKFYNLLGFIYSDFRNQLFKEGLCYQGMAYRHFAENILASFEQLKYKNILFAGFNALTKSEEIILKKAQQIKKAKILWDVDTYYLNDQMMEAGFYMRKHKKWDFQLESQAKSHFSSLEKTINIIGVAGTLGQARLAAQIIEQEQKEQLEKSPEQAKISALIPADENLLLPILNSFSKTAQENTNITMGFPLEHTHAYTLAQNLIKLHLHAAQLDQGKHHTLYRSELTAILSNDLIKSLNAYKTNPIKPSFQKFIKPIEVHALLQEANLEQLKDSFENCHNQPHLLLEKIHFLLNTVYENNQKSEIELLEENETDALLQLINTSKRLGSLVTEHDQPKQLKGLNILFKQLTIGLKQAFIGKTEKGLQLMGLLETRLMDFENLTILSLNEDILPASSFSNSFIPADIKHEFEMPGIQEKTAVYAYHFYRLLQRAKNIHLIYSTTKKALSGGEKSRFIKQLEFELLKYKSNISIKHQLLSFDDIKIPQKKIIRIEKDTSIMNKLEELAHKGLSPTRIISYIRCPLQFYFQSIAKIKETDQAEDIIDDRKLGDAIHKILEDFYKPFKGKVFPKEKLAPFLKEIPQLVEEYYAKEFKGNTDSGPNYLSLKDTSYYLTQFIKYEIQHNSPLEIIGVEEYLQRNMKLENGLLVKIHGNADRIDKKEGVIRILDYKTGAVDAKKIKYLEDPKKPNESIFTKPDYDKAIQLFVYHWMHKNTSYQTAQSGIISFRNIKNPYIMLEGSENMQYTEELFKNLIQEIFDKETAFEAQDKEDKICDFCNYRNICSK
ncbi:MAG: hypothetical protein B7C24_04095 [Bacteroidetes bacterium 4572_77]|nr:MAG: hypothetical protein B7C24_04095 [Bacteroidetes bacterium 4572_77]